MRRMILRAVVLVFAMAAGVASACPGEQAVQSAIDNNRVVLCMTPNQVMAAEPAGMARPQVHRRLLPTGPGVVEWIYTSRPQGWPVVVRFNGNRVIGYADVLPAYYRAHPDVLKP